MSHPVIVCHGPMPEQTRRRFDLVETVSVAQIIKDALPGVQPEELAHVRVVLVHRDQKQVVERIHWAQVRPHPGQTVVIQIAPGDGGIIALAVKAATLVTQLAGSAFGGIGGLGVVATNSVFFGTLAGIGYVGYRLASSLIPQLDQPGSGKKGRETYEISGWQNDARPNEAFPDLRGRMRVAPIFMARPYTEIVDGDQYIRALFSFGLGPVKIEDLRIGETSIDDFSDVELEIREGRGGDDPIELVDFQVLEETLGVDLVRPRPVDAFGKTLSNEPTVETPVVRETAANASAASVIISFPEGLRRIKKSNNKNDWRSVEIRIRQRQSGEDWQEVQTLKVREKRGKPFSRQYTWALPERGVWEIELTRMTADETENNKMSSATWSALQSFRPEQPINFDLPLSLVAVRIKASYQLNSTLETFNALATRYQDDWTGTEWVEGLPRNPAAHFVGVLQSAAGTDPATPDLIDWQAVQDWHEYCTAKGLKYDRQHDGSESLADVLRAICAAGRASPRRDGPLWSVVIDRAQDVIVDHISPRNSRQFRAQRSYFTPPDALRVRFSDETNAWQSAEKVIPWPGHVGPIDLTEEITLLGKTDPDEIEREVARRMYEMERRPDRFSVIQDGIARTATRGDTVMLSHYVLDDGQISARVSRIEGAVVELDEMLSIASDQDYALQFRVYEDDQDVIGASVVVAVTAAAGATRALRIKDSEDRPCLGEVVQFGRLNEVSTAARIAGIEPAEDMAFHLMLVNDAPELDALAEAHEISDWTPIVGTPSAGFALPSAPEFNGVDLDGSELIVAAKSQGSDAIFVGQIRVDHRLLGSATWSEAFIAGNAGAVALSYNDGDQIELRLTAINLDNLPGPSSAVLIYQYDAEPAPLGLDEEAISVTGGLGHAAISFAVSDVATTSVKICRVPDGEVLDTDLHAVATVGVTPGLSMAVIDGDSTRQDLLEQGGFDGVGTWVAGVGWSIAGGAATHTPGTASDLIQPVALSAGTTYRLFVDLTSVTAGSVTPQLTGGTSVIGAAFSGAGHHFERLEALAGNTSLTLAGDAGCDGVMDAAVLYAETASCAPQGQVAYVFIPLNEDDVAGPATSEIQTTIM